MSDIEIANFKNSFLKKADDFLLKFFMKLNKKKINTQNNLLDHLCYRVKSQEEYLSLKNNLNNISELLIESMVSGRKISTFKLFNPILFRQREIFIIELPEPKENSLYETGFEHGEFVIKESFKELEQKYLSCQFDWKGSDKKYNPELRLNLDIQCSVKFHHQSLEEVIEFEKTSSIIK